MNTRHHNRLVWVTAPLAAVALLNVAWSQVEWTQTPRSHPADAAQGSGNDSDGEAGSSGLVRVQPLPGNQQQGGQALPSQPFSSAEWLNRLSNHDLAQRESDYAQFIALARKDPRAMAWIEERAEDPSNPDLAWTARLALRELRSQYSLRGMIGIPGQNGVGNQGLGHSPFGQELNQLFEHFQELNRGFGFGAPGQGIPGLGFPGQEFFNNGFFERGFPSLPPGASGKSMSSNFKLEVGPDGVTATETKIEGGEEVTNEYKAGSMEELLELYPELKDRLQTGGRRSLFMDLGPGAKGFFFGGESGRGSGSNPFDFDNGSVQGQAMDEFFGDGSAQEPRTDVLGVYLNPVDIMRQERLELGENEGLLVLGTEPGTIAHALGITAGDVIVEINGQAIDSRESVTRIMGEREAKSELTVLFYDNWGEQQRRIWSPGTKPSTENLTESETPVGSGR